jgi:hypothetical protein
VTSPVGRWGRELRAHFVRNSGRRLAEQSRMITLNKAKRLALDGVAQVADRNTDDLRFLDAETQCSRTGWTFRVANALGNIRPVIVTHRGVVHVFREGRSVDQAVAELAQYRAECTTENRGG